MGGVFFTPPIFHLNFQQLSYLLVPPPHPQFTCALLMRNLTFLIPVKVIQPWLATEWTSKAEARTAARSILKWGWSLACRCLQIKSYLKVLHKHGKTLTSNWYQCPLFLCKFGLLDIEKKIYVYHTESLDKDYVTLCWEISFLRKDAFSKSWVLRCCRKS